MKLLRFVLPLALAAFVMSATGFAAPYSSCDEFNERDFQAVYDFIKCKRQIPLADKVNDLMISGDVRFEWENIVEKHDGERLRGRGALRDPRWFNGQRIPDNEFDVEFNLMLDYRGNCTWAVVQVEFDNNAGICVNRRGCCGTFVDGCDLNHNYTQDTLDGDPNGCHGSGVCDNICLRKAYFGWNIFEESCCRLDVEIGRRHFYDAFDSRVQFGSRFDGILFRYSNCFDCVADFYVNLGLFVIDESSNHWGWVTEIGMLNICDYGIDVKYSFIDWAKNGRNRCDVDDPRGMQFRVSQFSGAYHFNPELLCVPTTIYGAFLWNHDAEKWADTNFKRKHFGWYLGFMAGEVCQEGDWHVDINYQDIQLATVPDCDVSGIGRGNVRCVPNTVDISAGNTNYKGWRIEGLYALTDNLALNPSWEYSREEDVHIGGRHRFAKWELQFIYAF